MAVVKQDSDPNLVRFMTLIIKQVALPQAKKQTLRQQSYQVSYNSTTITTPTTQVISTTAMVTIVMLPIKRSPTLHSQVMWPLSRPQQHMVTV